MKNTLALLLIFAALALLPACGNEPTKVENQSAKPEILPAPDTALAAQMDTPTVKTEAKTAAPPPSVPRPAPKNERPKPKPESPKAEIPAGFVDVPALDNSIRLDIRYATTNNFMKKKVYDCPRCLLRPEAAEAIVRAHKTLKEKGLGLKMFDCYRPTPYQQRLWDITPDANYVAPPAKGSVHGRGLAVDLTIVDANGKELDMGTSYDFFGVEAHTDYTNLPAEVLANRRLLRETLAAVGFGAIENEWWHYNFKKAEYPLSDALWPCQ